MLVCNSSIFSHMVCAYKDLSLSEGLNLHEDGCGFE